MDNSIYINKSNIFIEQSSDLTMLARKTINYLIHIAENQHWNEQGLKVEILDLAIYLGLNLKSKYPTIIVAIFDELLSKQLIFVDDRTKQEVLKSNHLAGYHKTRHTIEFDFYAKAKPFLNINHDKNAGLDSKVKPYTHLNISITATFKGKHSISIYELMARHKNNINGEVKSIIHFEELKEKTNTVDKYPEYYAFYRRVLKPSIDEINEKSDLFIEIDLIRRNNRVHEVAFLIKAKNKIKHKATLDLVKTVAIEAKPTEPVVLEKRATEPKPVIQQVCTATTKHLPELVQELLKAGFDDDTELMRHWSGGEFGKHLIGEVFKAVKNYQNKGKPTNKFLIAALLKNEAIIAKARGKAEGVKTNLHFTEIRDAKAPCTVVVDSKELVQAKKEACEQNNRIFTKIWEETSEKNKVSILESIAKSDIQVFKHGALNIINSKDFSRKNIKENIWGLVMLQLQNIHNIPIIIPKEAPALAPASYDRSKIEDREAFLRLKDGMNDYFKGFDEMIKNSSYGKEFYAS